MQQHDPTPTHHSCVYRMPRLVPGIGGSNTSSISCSPFITIFTLLSLTVSLRAIFLCSSNSSCQRSLFEQGLRFLSSSSQAVSLESVALCVCVQEFVLYRLSPGAQTSAMQGACARAATFRSTAFCALTCCFSRTTGLIAAVHAAVSRCSGTKSTCTRDAGAASSLLKNQCYVIARAPASVLGTEPGQTKQVTFSDLSTFQHIRRAVESSSLEEPSVGCA